jgi:predicted DsbA family dithiol-disulfide isomerase
MDETGHNDAKEILFVADPMCSWCWGFSPVITAIDETGRGRAKITLVVGGLRPGTTEAMDEGMKATTGRRWAGPAASRSRSSSSSVTASSTTPSRRAAPR